MLTERQIALIQDSFIHVLPITDDAATIFYRNLFDRAPETRALFKSDMKLQGRKLFLMLSTVVDGLDRLDAIVPVARELAIRHVRYGARPQHYQAVGAALIETLRAGLGPSFDAETEAAWTGAYGVLSDVMLDAARQAA